MGCDCRAANSPWKGEELNLFNPVVALLYPRNFHMRSPRVQVYSQHWSTSCPHGEVLRKSSTVKYISTSIKLTIRSLPIITYRNTRCRTFLFGLHFLWILVVEFTISSCKESNSEKGMLTHASQNLSTQIVLKIRQLRWQDEYPSEVRLWMSHGQSS